MCVCTAIILYFVWAINTDTTCDMCELACVREATANKCRATIHHPAPLPHRGSGADARTQLIK